MNDAIAFNLFIPIGVLYEAILQKKITFTPDPPPISSDNNKMILKSQESVVFIKVGSSIGSGVLVSPNGRTFSLIVISRFDFN